jgi:hypothetical protein
MAKIKIIATPPGFAPEFIREQWVGIEIPLPTNEQIAENPPSELRTGNENEGGYLVLCSDAIAALKESEKYDAHDFWTTKGLGRYLLFKRDVCELID